MGGNILFLSGTVDKRTMEKYEREAKEAGRETWYLSWALDSTPQERSKGKTVEVGRAYFETAARRYTILDAPGHKNYVPNMIAGDAMASALHTRDHAFDPLAFTQQVATCPAVNRALNKTVDLHLRMHLKSR